MSETPHGYDASNPGWQGGPPQAPYGPGQPAAQPPAGGYAAPTWNNSPSNQQPGKGFFGALFDFSFTNFVTLSFAKLIYILAIALLAVTWLVLIFASFSESIGAGLGVLLLGWIPALFYVVLVRVGLEFSVAMVRTAQNTSELAQRR